MTRGFEERPSRTLEEIFGRRSRRLSRSRSSTGRFSHRTIKAHLSMSSPSLDPILSQYPAIVLLGGRSQQLQHRNSRFSIRVRLLRARHQEVIIWRRRRQHPESKNHSPQTLLPGSYLFQATQVGSCSTWTMKQKKAHSARRQSG